MLLPFAWVRFTLNSREKLNLYGVGRVPLPSLREDFVYPASKEETIPFPLAETARLKFSFNILCFDYSLMLRTISNAEVSSSQAPQLLGFFLSGRVHLSRANTRTRGKCSVGAYLCVRPLTEIRLTLHLVHFTAGASPRPTIIDIASHEGECVFL